MIAIDHGVKVNSQPLGIPGPHKSREHDTCRDCIKDYHLKHVLLLKYRHQACVGNHINLVLPSTSNLRGIQSARPRGKSHWITGSSQCHGRKIMDTSKTNKDKVLPFERCGDDKSHCVGRVVFAVCCRTVSLSSDSA